MRIFILTAPAKMAFACALSFFSLFAYTTETEEAEQERPEQIAKRLWDLHCDPQSAIWDQPATTVHWYMHKQCHLFERGRLPLAYYKALAERQAGLRQSNAIESHAKDRPPAAAEGMNNSLAQPERRRSL